jgi:hypothetical protein
MEFEFPFPGSLTSVYLPSSNHTPLSFFCVWMHTGIPRPKETATPLRATIGLYAILLQGPRGRRFLMREATLYRSHDKDACERAFDYRKL